MNLASPLRSLIPSLDSAVLEAVARTESAINLTSIVRLARRGSRAGVTSVLERLVAHGLVIAEESNRGALYRLNREHLLTPSILEAVNAARELRHRIAGELGALHPALVRAVLFGSMARGDAGPESDIDVLLVVRNGTDVHAADWVGSLHAIADRALAWTGNRMEALVLTEDQWEDARARGEAIVSEIERDAIDLAVGDHAEVTR